MAEQSGYDTNPLVGVTREETLTNCLDQVEFLQQAGDGMHYGFYVNLTLIRGALGHELAKEAKKAGDSSLDG